MEKLEKSLLKLDTSLTVDNKILTRKHIAERQRRAKINFYLEEIQQLTSLKNNTTEPVKPEKAEVLERAVTFLEKSPKIVNYTESLTDTECYKRGFKSCMSALLDQIADSQTNTELQDLREHLENFLHNLTTEAETMSSQFECIPAMPASYNHSHSAERYQSPNGYGAMKTVSQSHQMLQYGISGSGYSGSNDQMNSHSQNLLCKVQDNPLWYSDWNTQMQMQYIQTYQEHKSDQEFSTYDAFQGIKSVYSNYLQDGDAVSISDGQSKNILKISQENHNHAVLSNTCAQTYDSEKGTDSRMQSGNNSPRDNSANESKLIPESRAVRNSSTLPINGSQQANERASHRIWRPW